MIEGQLVDHGINARCDLFGSDVASAETARIQNARTARLLDWQVDAARELARAPINGSPWLQRADLTSDDSKWNGVVEPPSFDFESED
jgi:hypothetical protein